MNYIVSVENTSYHLWQLELLIESFKLQQMEDELVIAVAETEEKVIKTFTNNTAKHRRIFLHENYGRKNNCPYLNKTYAVITALKEGVIKPPFAVIEPDMVLLEPLEISNHDMTYSHDWRLSQDMLQFHGYNINEVLGKLMYTQDRTDNPWFPLGGTVLFGENINLDFFTNAIKWTEIIQNRRKDKSHIKYLDKAGWVLAAISDNLTLSNNPHYESGLMDSGKSHFLHYNEGMLPVFAKRMFQFKSDCILKEEANPYDLLLKHNPTYATEKLHAIIKSYQKNKEVVHDI